MKLATALTLSGLIPSISYALQHAFSPEDMLSAPRPQSATASPEGSHALSVVDQWDPKTDKTQRRIYLLPLKTTVTLPPVSLLNTTSAAASEFIWLDDTTFGYLNGSTLLSYNVEYTTEASSKPAPGPEELLVFPSGVNPSSLRFEPITGTLAFSGQVWQDGSFVNTGKHDEIYEEKGDTAQVYDDLMVRHWDTWRVSGKVWTLGTVTLSKADGKWASAESKKGNYEIINILNNTKLVSQTDPIDASSFALSSSQIAVAIKPPYLSHATHTREDIYIFSLSDPTKSPKHITPHDHGAISGLAFSPSGHKLAWLEMAKDGYESDRRVVVVYDVKDGESTRWTQGWDRSPSSLAWSVDGKSLYLLAEHQGSTLPYHIAHADHLPTPLLFNGTTTSITPLTANTLLLARQSLISPSDEFIYSLPVADFVEVEVGKGGDGDKVPRNEPLRRLTSFSEHHIDGKLDGQVGEEFWFEGAEKKQVMGWAVKPRGWKPDQEAEYPLAFLIHGGPQGAWEDSWSTRWNPALIAFQGYFVIAINPTGSTGYGQDFTDAIQGDWGGKPFKDLLAGYHAALERYPEIDRERTTALGASYGGYMINWINGHNDHFGFKALVCHDGVFDTVTTFFSTEEVYFPIQDFEGTPWTNRAVYEKWSPVNHVLEWNTPELVIQGGKDFRLENSQGLGAFTALQVQGVPSRFVYFPDENHWVLKPRNSMRWHHEVFKWLEEWVGKVKDQSENGVAEAENDDAGLIIQL